MALQNILGDIALDATSKEIAEGVRQNFLINVVLKVLARLNFDTAGALRAAITSGTINTVSTVSTLNNAAAGSMNQVGTSSTLLRNVYHTGFRSNISF